VSVARPRVAARPGNGPYAPGGTSADAFARRRRSARRRRWLRVGLVVLPLAVLAAGAWVVLQSSLLAVTTVDVVGAQRVSTGQVRGAAEVPLGRPLARVDLGSVERRVEQLPAVASAVATRVWPHTVRITVVERRPVAVARSASGWQLLDEHAVDIGATSTAPPGLPVLALDPATTDPAVLLAATQVAAELPPRLRARVEQVVARSPDDVRLALVSGEAVRWGSADDGTLKAQVLAALMRKPAHVYDVSAPDAPTTR
jgi:cell division protein FtsQ